MSGGLADFMPYVPTVPEPWNLWMFIMNIFLPGIGTMVGSGLWDFDGMKMIIGLIQLLTCWLVIGWIWSIIWGYMIWQKGSGKYPFAGN